MNDCAEPKPAPPRVPVTLWWTLGGAFVAIALAFILSPRIAGVALAIHLGALGLVRLVWPGQGPTSMRARSRFFDVAFLWLGALGTMVMSLTAENL